MTAELRVAIEIGLATGLWALGLSWELGFGAVVDLAVSVVWVVAVVNAFNLFDNMDGAASSMACVVAGALAVLGLANGDTWLCVVAAALCGACAGFLPHNLTSPARIFLGDGGSMPIGFAVATLAMIGLGDAAREWQSLAMGLLFVGVPALDTGLVVVRDGDVASRFSQAAATTSHTGRGGACRPRVRWRLPSVELKR